MKRLLEAPCVECFHPIKEHRELPRDRLPDQCWAFVRTVGYRSVRCGCRRTHDEAIAGVVDLWMEEARDGQLERELHDAYLRFQRAYA